MEVFEGNTSDTSTLKSQIEKVRKRFGINNNVSSTKILWPTENTRPMLEVVFLKVWCYGYKISSRYLIINDRGELLAFKLTSGKTDDRKPVPELTEDLIGKLFGDRGYISQELFEKLDEQGLQLITRYKKKMKQKLVKLKGKFSYTVELKNLSQS